MKLKKIIAAIAAAAMAVSMTAVSAFATTVEIDSEYPGSFNTSGKGISKEELKAVGGDVKIVLNIEVYDEYGLADQYLVNPIDYDGGWKTQTDLITSDTAIAKTDGWICVTKDTTTVEFVYPASAIDALGDTGLCFSCQYVIVKSADYELASGPEGELTRVSDQEGKDYCMGKYDPKAGAADTGSADASTADAPAGDSATTSSETGNVPAAVMVSVMAVAGAVTVASRKRK